MIEFDILVPVGGSHHYLAVTSVGRKRGLVIKWTPGRDGWQPSVRHLDDILQSDDFQNGKGYIRMSLEEVEPEALMAITGTVR